MNIILFSRMSTSLRPEFLRQIIGLMSDMGFDWCANEELAHELERLGICRRSQIKSYALTVGHQPQPSTMVCIGGDGTILEGIRRLEGDDSKDLELYRQTGTPQYERLVDEMRRELHITTLKFNSLENLVAAIGLPKADLCTHCWDGSGEE